MSLQVSSQKLFEYTPGVFWKGLNIKLLSSKSSAKDPVHWPPCWILFQEIYYYTNSGSILKSENISSEAVGVIIRDRGNQELAEALTADGGPLQSGLLPQVECGTEEGKKAVLESIAGEAAISKVKKEKEPKTAEVAEPKTIMEFLISTR